MIDVSEAMVREAFAQQAKPPAALVTIDYEGLAEPIRVTDWAGDLGDGTYGLVADGETYLFAPFRITLGGAGRDDGAKEAKLEIAALGEVVETIRLAPSTAQPSATIELVRVAAPDVVERAMRGTKVGSAEVSEGVVIVTLRTRDYAREYAVGPRYTQGRTPGLF